MKNNRVIALIVSAGLVLGLSLLGFFVKMGFESISADNRYVSVRGLAEREVKADHVIWPIVYKTTGNDLQSLYAEINSKNKKIRQFIEKNGIPQKDIIVNTPKIVDLYAERYVDRKQVAERYNVTVTLTVSTTVVDPVIELIPRMAELLPQGIAVVTDEYTSNPQYEFRNLNSIKPDMIAEATKKAREAADKFAEDSNSGIGKIRKAQQGLFSIDVPDNSRPWMMNVRVVTNVDFFLEQ